METQTQPESVTFKVPEDPASIEKEQEAKLKAKYGPLVKKPGGGSALLQKRLNKGPKYFDSGDYNMAKAKMNNPKKPLPAREKLMLQESLGAAIPTPGEVEHMRRPSQIASKLLIHDVEGEGDGQIDG
ncbi:cAMP-regulated phosphoprotein 19-like [Mya arenaria]|uniref:cAMP-regulated phosphoprotein 19-like n=1 Tax=Mya arenaria TaxID=6604 RepID=UPI0022E390D0|nr:cAMP-regulated phosphoprotein 19-like [Mya arenaria]XP_052797065.1 cAMP-regulated phosphoprotein 19-like [Mya arenaria]